MARRDQLRTAKNKEAFMKAYTDCNGNMEKAAEMVGVSRKTPYNWMKKDPAYKRRLHTRLEEIHQLVEEKLMLLITNNHIPSIFFYLRKRHPKFMSTTRRFQYEQQAIEYMDWQMKEVEPDMRVFRCAVCKSKDIEPSSWGIRTATPSGRAPRLKKYPPARAAESG